ncbi:hypothetical protein J4Q44_G00392650, partial [Coregonus suidteri]
MPPLDRETQDQFQISIVVERPDGREIAKPVELRVMVGDAQRQQAHVPYYTQYHTPWSKELAPRGTEILTVQAADNDDPKTDNVRIFYPLVGQIPESPRALFRVDRDSGVISVQADNLEGAAPTVHTDHHGLRTLKVTNSTAWQCGSVVLGRGVRDYFHKDNVC